MKKKRKFDHLRRFLKLAAAELYRQIDLLGLRANDSGRKRTAAASARSISRCIVGRRMAGDSKAYYPLGELDIRPAEQRGQPFTHEEFWSNLHNVLERQLHIVEEDSTEDYFKSIVL